MNTIIEKIKNFVEVQLKSNKTLSKVHSNFAAFGTEDEIILRYLSTLEKECEKPTNIDFEQELYKHFGQVKDFTLGMQIGKYFYELGKQEKPTTAEGLEEEIERYLHSSSSVRIRFGYGGWVDGMEDNDLREIARHFAQWGAEHAKKDEISVSDDLEEASCKYHRTHTDEVMDYDGYHNGNTKEVYDVTPGESFITGAKWHKEQMMIQWTGNNLKDVIEFTGKSPRFNEWFKSWDDYEDYVRQHGNIFKMFNDDGSHLEVPVGAWIVKTPDKRCVASKFTLKQPESEKIAAAYQLGLADKEKKMMKDAVESEVWNYSSNEDLRAIPIWGINKFRHLKDGDKVRIIIVKED